MKSNSARIYILNFSWKKKQKYSASDLVEICDETKVADNRYQYHSCSHINTYFCILGILVSFEIVLHQTLKWLAQWRMINLNFTQQISFLSVEETFSAFQKKWELWKFAVEQFETGRLSEISQIFCKVHSSYNFWRTICPFLDREILVWDLPRSLPCVPEKCTLLTEWILSWQAVGRRNLEQILDSFLRVVSNVYVYHRP